MLFRSEKDAKRLQSWVCAAERRFEICPQAQPRALTRTNQELFFERTRSSNKNGCEMKRPVARETPTIRYPVNRRAPKNLVQLVAYFFNVGPTSRPTSRRASPPGFSLPSFFSYVFCCFPFCHASSRNRFYF